MTDLKAYLNKIETVDDYFKYKETLAKPNHLQTSKPLGSFNDYYEDPALKKPSKQAYDLNFKDNFNNLDMSNSHYLGESNFLKENVIPKELKENQNMNKLSRVGEFKVFGNEATNESMVENSFLKQLNIKKNFNVMNMFQADKAQLQTEPEKPKPTYKTSDFDKNLLTQTSGYGYNNNILKPTTHFDYGASLSSKYMKSTMSNGSSNYNKFKVPDRPDAKGTYIDNNDIRAYLNSLDTRLVIDNKSSSQADSKSRSVSAHNKKKNKNKGRKMDLSVIEDDMEGEEQENKVYDDKKKVKKSKKKVEYSDSEEEMPKKNQKGRRKPSKSIYEEDLTKNFSEKDLSLHSANHFNQNYKKPQYKKDSSDNSLPSKVKEQDYLNHKYGKSLPKEDKIMDFLDNICEVICMNCGEMVDLNIVDQHSFECFKAIAKTPGTDDLATLNKQLKQIAYLLKKKLKNIKEYINEHEDSEHFYFNYTLMIIECLTQIIQNDQNLVSLVSNIKDINAFNKSLSENHTPLAQFILSITYRIKPLAKLKIPCIDPTMTWEDAKNFREKSILNQNLKTEMKSQIFRESHKAHNSSMMRESAMSGNMFLRNAGLNNNNVSMIKEDDGGKKEFFQIVVETKLNLDRNHPGRNWKAEEMYNEVKRMRLGKESWREYVEGRFNEMGNLQE